VRIPSPEKPVAQPLQFMWERHHEMARRLVAGDKPGDICRDMNITPSRFSIIRRSPIFEQYLNSLSIQATNSAVDVRTRISECSPKAMEVLEEVLSPIGKEKFDARLRVKVAHDMLDRDGFGAVQKSANFSAVMTADDIERLKSRRQPMVIVNP